MPVATNHRATTLDSASLDQFAELLGYLPAPSITSNRFSDRNGKPCTQGRSRRQVIEQPTILRTEIDDHTYVIGYHGHGPQPFTLHHRYQDGKWELVGSSATRGEMTRLYLLTLVSLLAQQITG